MTIRAPQPTSEDSGRLESDRGNFRVLKFRCANETLKRDGISGHAAWRSRIGDSSPVSSHESQGKVPEVDSYMASALRLVVKVFDAGVGRFVTR